MSFCCLQKHTAVIIKKIMVHYEKSEYLSVDFSAFVVRSDSIDEAYGGCALFSERFKLGGITNSKLLCVCFMTSLSDSIFDLEAELLTGVGMKHKEDDIYFDTEIICGVKYEISEGAYKELPCTKNLNWIKSILLASSNYVWFTGPEISMKERQKQVNTISCFYGKPSTIDNFNPLLTAEVKANYLYKIDSKEQLQPIRKILLDRE